MTYFLTILKRLEAKTKSFNALLSEVKISSLFPTHSLCPLSKNTIFSPIPITEFISCVLMIVVMLYSRVISRTNSSMRMEVRGSNPGIRLSHKINILDLAQSLGRSQHVFACLRLFQKEKGRLLLSGLLYPDKILHALSVRLKIYE